MRNNQKPEIAKTIKAIFSKGVIEPLENIAISDGEEITITIVKFALKTKRKKLQEALKATAGSWRNLVDAEKLKRNIYHDRLITTRAEIKL